jgi:hypothetical protein
MTNKGNTSFFDNLKNMNYKYDFLCTYKLLENQDNQENEENEETDCANLCYQTQLLKALNMKNYDDFIITKNIEAIYFFLKDNNEVVSLLLALKEKYKNSSMAFFIENELALFQLLFSYDYFDIFHKCLSKYIITKTQTTDLIIDKKYFDEVYKVINAK